MSNSFLLRIKLSDSKKQYNKSREVVEERKRFYILALLMPLFFLTFGQSLPHIFLLHSASQTLQPVLVTCSLSTPGILLQEASVFHSEVISSLSQLRFDWKKDIFILANGQNWQTEVAKGIIMCPEI